MTGTAPLPTPATTAPARRRALVAASIGNFIEWYDFTVYGLVAVVIAPLFFPSADPVASLLATFGVFGLGFVVRPLGALVFGSLGDRVGRRRTLATVILLMAGGTALIGVTPTYAAVGVLAPLLLIVGRVLQGFSAGGEYAGASTYIVEYAPDGRRGYYASWQSFSQILGVLFGSVVSVAVTTTLSPAAVTSWGWRVPFLVSVPFAGVALYLRLWLEETPHFRTVEVTHHVERSPLATGLRSQVRGILVALGLYALSTGGAYIYFIYMPTYLQAQLHLPPARALLSNIVSLCVLLALAPVVGRLTDRVGRRPVLLAGSIAVLVLSYPLFLLLAAGSFPLTVLAQAVGCAVLSLAIVPQVALIAELFPTSVRLSSFALATALGVVLFGGTAPLVSTYLIAATGNALAPAYFVMFTALLCTVAAWVTDDPWRAELREW